MRLLYILAVTFLLGYLTGDTLAVQRLTVPASKPAMAGVPLPPISPPVPTTEETSDIDPPCVAVVRGTGKGRDWQGNPIDMPEVEEGEYHA